MPSGLRRIHGAGDWHFITCSCYHRQQFFASIRHKDLFLQILEEVRISHNFIVGGYVVMPEHFHLLISEPERGTVSLTMQVLKQRFSRACREKQRDMEITSAFWQRRYYDFNIYSERKYTEKLRYIHRNPVRRGLAASPELWQWSSFRYYLLGEEGPVKVGSYRGPTLSHNPRKGRAPRTPRLYRFTKPRKKATYPPLHMCL
jgi:putative transposase